MENPFNFFRRKADVLDHWVGFADQFQMSSVDFYEGLVKELEKRKVPGLTLDRIEFGEGSILSDKRVYLRMVRERLVFDVCAAPFGTGFFFSCRMAEIPAVIRWWHLLIIAGLFGVGLYVTTKVAGFFWGIPLLLLIAGLVIYVCRNSVSMGLANVDTYLIRDPVFGPIYERFIRKETYYRQDTRLMYLDLIPKLVKTLAEEATSAKGIKLVRQWELPTVLGELYKPVHPRLDLELKA